MNRFKTLSMAAMLALAVGSSFSGLAMAAVAGGGSPGDGGPGGSIGFDAPGISQINLPSYPQSRPDMQTAQSCRFELLRGHFCEPIRR
jgi:hypothetical protein